jgi:hypothetical protein
MSTNFRERGKNEKDTKQLPVRRISVAPKIRRLSSMTTTTLGSPAQWAQSKDEE